MKAIARHWVKYGGAWRQTGETFEINKADAEEMRKFADVIPDEAQEQEQTVRRGRKRKTEADGT